MPTSQRKLPALLLCSVSPTERMESPQQVAEQRSGESGLFPSYLGPTLYFRFRLIQLATKNIYM